MSFSCKAACFGKGRIFSFHTCGKRLEGMWAKLEMYRLLDWWIVETKIVGHDKLENSKTAEPPSVFLVPLENPQWAGVYQHNFIMFRCAMQELLNFQCFQNWKFNNNEQSNFYGNLGCALNMHKKLLISTSAPRSSFMISGIIEFWVIRVNQPITDHLPMNKHFSRFFSVFLHFEWFKML